MRRPSESTTAVWSNRAAGAGPAGASGVHVSVAGRDSQRSASAVPADSPPNTISPSFTSSRITQAPPRGLGGTLGGGRGRIPPGGGTGEGGRGRGVVGEKLRGPAVGKRELQGAGRVSHKPGEPAGDDHAVRRRIEARGGVATRRRRRGRREQAPTRSARRELPGQVRGVGRQPIRDVAAEGQHAVTPRVEHRRTGAAE